MLTDVKELLEKLLDENNWDPIEITNSRGETARFNQIALIPETAESKIYEDENVEHNFAIIHPINDQNEEIDRPIVIDIVIDENGEYHLLMVDDPNVVALVYEAYREIRGITPDDIASDEDVDELEKFEYGDGTDENESEENADADTDVADVTVEEEKPAEKEKKGFFGLFGKKKK